MHLGRLFLPRVCCETYFIFLIILNLPLENDSNICYHINMSKRDKLITKILAGICITFAEAERLLLDLGYQAEFPQGGSSHKTFRKQNCNMITLVSTQKPLKKYAMKMIIEALIKEGYND